MYESVRCTRRVLLYIIQSAKKKKKSLRFFFQPKLHSIFFMLFAFFLLHSFFSRAYCHINKVQELRMEWGQASLRDHTLKLPFRIFVHPPQPGKKKFFTFFWYSNAFLHAYVYFPWNKSKFSFTCMHACMLAGKFMHRSAAGKGKKALHKNSFVFSLDTSTSMPAVGLNDWEPARCPQRAYK